MKKSQKIFLITSAIIGVMIVFVTCAIAIFNVDEKIQTLASIGALDIQESLATSGEEKEGGSVGGPIEGGIGGLIDGGLGEIIGNQEKYGPENSSDIEWKQATKALEKSLAQLELGFFETELNPFKISEKEQKELYKEVEGVEPVEDPGNGPTSIKGEITGQDYYINSGWIEYTFSYTYKGKKESVSIKKTYSVYAPSKEDFMKEEKYKKFSEERNKKVKEYEEIKGKYDEYIKKFSDWSYKTAVFKQRDPDEIYDYYTAFWVRVAEKKLGVQLSTKQDNEKLGNFTSVDRLQVFNKFLNNVKGKITDLKPGTELSEEEKKSIAEFGNTAKEEMDKVITEEEGGSSGGGSGGGSTSGEGSSGGSGGGNTSGGEGEKPEEPVDKVAPSISKVSVTSPSSGNYREGQEIKIKVEFDKNIYGTEKKIVINKNTAPKLFIKFGVGGENKLTTFDSANGKAINYSYKIQKEDTGKLEIGSGDNFIGTVYNESGVKADLTKIEKLEETKEIVADNLGPSVQKIEAISEAGEYKIGDKIEIKVSFNEKIYGTKDKTPIIDETAPILQIYFGEGNKKETTYKSYDNTDNSLLYEYTITHEDRGELKVDVEESFTMKEIYDEIGNVTQLIKGKELTGNVIKANSGLTQITFDKKEITLDLNGMKTAQINATISSNNKKLIWETADKNIAIVDETGKVTGIAIGETTITAKAEDGAQASCKVTVKDTTNGNTKVKLNRERLELDLNGTKEEKLIATVEPKEMEITWSSSDKNIATVDETGKVVAISTGETQIIAKAKDGTTAICTVIVTNSNKNEIEPTSIETNIKNIQVVLGRTQTLQLKTTIIPSNSNKNTKVTYKSSDENIATVDETGKVTIKAKGTVVITATTANGKKAYSTIEVIEIETGSNLKIGDINSDGNIDTTDLLLILRHMAVMSSEEISTKHQDWILENEKFLLGDINANGIIDITDALKIQRHMAASKSETIQTNHPDWIIQTNW